MWQSTLRWRYLPILSECRTEKEFGNRPLDVRSARALDFNRSKLTKHNNMNNTERKYRKPVNTNGWMRKLQKWTWGDSTPNFVGYCPFFWFTWLSVLVMPITLIRKIVAAIFHFIGSAIPERIRKVQRPREAVLALLYDHCLKMGVGRAYADWLAEDDAVSEWLKATPDWLNCAERAYRNQQRKAAHEVVWAPRRNAFAQFMSRYAGYVVKPVLWAAGLAGLYVLGRALFSLIYNISLEVLIIMGQITAGVMVGTGFMYGVIRVVAWFIMKRRCRCPKNPDKVTWYHRVGLGLDNALEFVCETIESTYIRECPLIQWDDHDEPIQPRG